ncbi:MAG: hypothetical protein HRU15_11240 [Planctomycetes bacterium]|nr:hypothetical protein [Planctomycetota bacterium]
MNLLHSSLLFACAVLLSSCGSERFQGDMDGMPIKFHVMLDRAFVDDMESRQGQLGSSVQHTVGSGGSSTGVGFGLSFQSTNVKLYGGDGPGQANIFRQKLKWGLNEFEIPLRPGRKITLSVVVSGGRAGWESIGEHIIKEIQPRIYLSLGARGPEFLDDKKK